MKATKQSATKPIDNSRKPMRSRSPRVAETKAWILGIGEADTSAAELEAAASTAIANAARRIGPQDSEGDKRSTASLSKRAPLAIMYHDPDLLLDHDGAAGFST